MGQPKQFNIPDKDALNEDSIQIPFSPTSEVDL